MYQNSWFWYIVVNWQGNDVGHADSFIVLLTALSVTDIYISDDEYYVGFLYFIHSSRTDKDRKMKMFKENKFFT